MIAAPLLLSLAQLAPSAPQASFGEYPDTVVSTVLDGGGEMYVDEPVSGSFQQLTGIGFDETGRLYAWQKVGLVWVVEDGEKAPQPLVDIQEEVAEWNQHGLMSFAVDPDFYENGFVYLFYAVDYHHLSKFGTPEYDPEVDEDNVATIARITRYEVFDPTDPHTTVDPSTRFVVVGDSPATGFPICSNSHATGMIQFAYDGSLLASFGDSVSGDTYDCSEMLSPSEDVGRFRSQLIDTLSGKLLRINARTGEGVPNNPWFDPLEPRAPRSMVWSLGLRQPFRFGVGAPADGDPTQPGVIYIGDVGAQGAEELNVAREGGLNFGWPMYEGHELNPVLGGTPTPNLDAPNPLFGVDVPGVGICTQEFFDFQDLFQQDALLPEPLANPCDPASPIAEELTHVHERPQVSWSHVSGAFVGSYDLDGNALTLPIEDLQSPVQGEPFSGICSIGGVWYDGANFPPRFRNSYIQSDFGLGWLKAFYFDDEDRLTEVVTFASTAGAPTAFALHPVTGELYYVDYYGDTATSWGVIRKLHFPEVVPAIAVAEAQPTSGSTPLVVQFRGTKSTAPEGGPISYAWDFGDGSPISNAANPIHVFEGDDDSNEGDDDDDPLTREVTLTVTYQGGLVDTDTVEIALNNAAPVVAIFTPEIGTTYTPGSFLSLSLLGLAADPDDPEELVECSWQVIERHSSYDYFKAPLSFCPGGDVFLVTPDTAPGDVRYYEIRYSATDDTGLSSEVARFVGPDNDCDLDGYPDPEAIALGLVDDLDENGIPDACEVDCNANSIADAFELVTYGSDCNGNGVPDDCDLAQGTAFDFDGNGVLDGCQGISLDTDAISLAAGGVQTHAVDLGSTYGGYFYWMLGTASGTFPGFKAGPTVVPLNLPDPYLTITATQANQGPFVSTIGVLDGNGAATAAILLPPGLPATLAGLELAHSFLVAEPGPAGLNDTVLATDAMPLRFDP